MEPNDRETQALKIDREDLQALLQLRFGSIPIDVQETISQVRQPDVMQRLILVAANVPDWPGFLQELQAGDESFRLVGEDFNPLSKNPGRRT